MKLTIDEPEINIGVDGFEKCLLGRSEFGKQFTELVDKIDGPLVVALDGGWGSGKSVFLKMWTGAHKKDFDGKAKIIYFDAFEHDFLDDPLISLVSSLSDHFPQKSKGQKVVFGLKKAAAPLAKVALRVGLAVGTAGATEVLGVVGDEAIKTGANLADTEIANFWAKADGQIMAMKGFKKALEELTAGQNGESQKIVIIVDELDRCRPDYALAFLEVIKHFFAVPNVHFVLGVNLWSLENSVRARYGQGIEAADYLKKFIHLQVRLPSRNISGLGGSYTLLYFDRIFKQIDTTIDIIVALENCLTALEGTVEISLRDIERIYTKVVLLPEKFQRYQFGFQYSICTALLMSVLAPDIYNLIGNRKLTIHDVGKFFDFNKGGRFAKPDFSPENSGDDDRFRCLTYSLWHRILALPMDEDVQGLTEQAFGRFTRLSLDSFIQTLGEILEIWEMNDKPKVV